MEVRKLRPEEFDQMTDLGAFAFQFTPSEEDRREQREHLQQDDVWGVLVDGRLASGLVVIPFETYIRQQVVSTGGVAAVASWPEYRRQGHVRSLLHSALEDMKAQGQVLSNLFPFKHSFYGAFGWEKAGTRLKYTMPMHRCPRFPQGPGRILPIDDWKTIDAVHSQFAPRFSGTHKRSEQWWKNRILKPERRVCAFENNGRLEGYLVYHVRDNKMVCHEWVNLTLEARYGLWNFVANHDSMAESLTWFEYSDGTDLHVLPDPPDSVEMRLEHMSRIVDLPALLRTMHAEAPSDCVVLRVEDTSCPWNHGEWKISSNGQTFSVEENNGSTVDLHCGIGPLTAVLLGAASIQEYVRAGTIAGSEDALAVMEQWFPKYPCTSMDFY